MIYPDDSLMEIYSGSAASLLTELDYRLRDTYGTLPFRDIRTSADRTKIFYELANRRRYTVIVTEGWPDEP